MKKKLLALGLVTVLILALLSGCGGGTTTTEAPASGTEAPSSGTEAPSSGETGSVYYLNFKPEADAAWQALAEAYTAETGVEVKVTTAASGNYETTLKSEMAKTDAPTLFQVNGPVGLASWSDYCYDLTGTDFANELTSDDFKLMDGEKLAGIAYVYEGYGIIVNTALLSEAGYTTADITDFASLKAVLVDISAG